MKSAIVHEWFVNFAGSEKVVESIYSLYPSPVYTLFYSKKEIEKSFLRNAEIHSSFLQKFPFINSKYRFYLPFYPLAVENLNLSDYDIILSSSHSVAKGILSRSDQIHICYCHTPIRYAWDLYFEYLSRSKLDKKWEGIFAKLILHYIRMWDVASANRVDYFIANSKYVAGRIAKIYGKKAEVIYPPVEIEKFPLDTSKEDYYLCVSRFVPYKRIDLIVEAFNEMPDRKLVVIGDGPDFKRIKKMARGNIELLGYQPDQEMVKYMQKAKAFIFAADEDFGITPVEAQSCGTPVIALGRGGTLETVIPEKTGLFFMNPSVDSIIEKVREFDQKIDKFDATFIHNHAKKFSKENFLTHYKQYVDSILEKEGVK